MKTRFFKRRKVPISKSNKVAQMGIKVIIKMFWSGNEKKKMLFNCGMNYLLKKSICSADVYH